MDVWCRKITLVRYNENHPIIIESPWIYLRPGTFRVSSGQGNNPKWQQMKLYFVKLFLSPTQRSLSLSDAKPVIPVALFAAV